MTEHNNSFRDLDHDVLKLRELGWSDHFERELAAMDTARGRIARIVCIQREWFTVSDGNKEWHCAPAGKIRSATDGSYPVTGDWVLTHDGVITRVIPRRTLLSRGEAGSHNNRNGGSGRRQAIAANLDTVFIVCGLDRDFNVRRLERYMTLVHNCGLEPVMVLTKADLPEDPDSLRSEVETIAFGVPVILTSMVDGRGREELEAFLGKGRTVAMIGSSGAGKSTLANMLHGSDIQLTSHVSDSVGKGRHTTTTRQLIPMPQGGLLMDNPGIREIAFHEDGQGMETTFADILELAEECRFADCSHQHEPGCAVMRAVESGGLSADRLESYRKMQREMQFLAERSVKSADRVEKERWQGIARRRRSLNKNSRS